jgi:hypothetical protein
MMVSVVPNLGLIEPDNMCIGLFCMRPRLLFVKPREIDKVS